MELPDLGSALDLGFPETTAEKVGRLLAILRTLEAFPETRGRFVLKGGTALNVFHLERIPRLGVDIDLMVTGFANAMPGSTAQRRAVELVIGEARRLGYAVSTSPSPTACTIRCSYENLLGTRDSLKIDLDLLNR
jgi:predicted nucleotidyltransferase component of viral defense system